MPGLRTVFVALYEIGPFVHVEADAVAGAGAVDRVSHRPWPETAAIDDPAGGNVDVPRSGFAGFGGPAKPASLGRLFSRFQTSRWRLGRFRRKRRSGG